MEHSKILMVPVNLPIGSDWMAGRHETIEIQETPSRGAKRNLLILPGLTYSEDLKDTVVVSPKLPKTPSFCITLQNQSFTDLHNHLLCILKWEQI
jgi:hypothetical protein